MSKKEFIISSIFTFIGAFIMLTVILNQNKRIENLNKQIELLECYKENYLIMADSLDGIHNTCFKIGN